MYEFGQRWLKEWKLINIHVTIVNMVGKGRKRASK